MLILIIIGFIAWKYYKNKTASMDFEVDGNCRCPYCSAVFETHEGYIQCPHCNKSFGLRDGKTIKGENCISPRLRFISRIAGILSKVDGKVTQGEVDCLNSYLTTLNVNSMQRNLCAEDFNEYKYKEFNREEFLQNYFVFLPTDRIDTIPKFLRDLISLDGGATPKQTDIVKQILEILSVSFKIENDGSITYVTDSNNSTTRGDTYSSNSTNDIEVNCPYCHKQCFIESEGIWNCPYCNRAFKYSMGEVYSEDDTVLEVHENMMKLIAFLSKAGGNVTNSQTIFISEYCKDMEFSEREFTYCKKVFNTFRYRLPNSVEVENVAEGLATEKISPILFVGLMKAFIELNGQATSDQWYIVRIVLKVLKIELSEYNKLNPKDYYNEGMDDGTKPVEPGGEGLIKIFAFLSRARGKVLQSEINYITQYSNSEDWSKEQFKYCVSIFNMYKNVNPSDKEISIIANGFSIGYHNIDWYFGKIREFINLRGEMNESQQNLILSLITILGLTWNEFYDGYEDKSKSKDDNSYSDYYDKYYTILNISCSATNDDIKKIYRQLIKKYHPDMYVSQNLSESEKQKRRERFDEIQNAYNIIKERRGF